MTKKKILHCILHRVSTAWVVFITALVATIWGSLIVENVEQQQIKQNVFDYRVEQIQTLIKNRITTYQQILHSGVGLFAASETVSRQEWFRFVKHLNINKRYPGIQGIGFSKVISPQDKESHTQEIQSEGGFFLDYEIRPEGNREQYTSIVYLEPMDRRNQAAIGYDMFSEPVRRLAMERARDTGEAALSGKVTLVQEIDENKQAGFLIYVPVYRKDVPLNTIEEKRAALLGYVYSPFRMNDFMQGLFGDKPSGIDIHIYDGDFKQNLSAIQLMYDEMPDHHLEDNSFYQPQFDSIEKLEIAGHIWSIYFYSLPSLPSFEIATKTYAYKVILFGGILMSGLLFGFTRSFETAHLLQTEHKLNQQLQKEIAERKQIEITLKELNRDFMAMLENTSDFIYFKDKESRIHFCSQTLANITGHRHWKEMVGKHDFEMFPKETAQIYYEEELPIFEGREKKIDKIDPYYDEQGNIGWVHTNKWAVLNDYEEIVGIFGISRDISERKRMEIELNEAKQLSDKIINSLPGIFYMLDSQGNFVRWNSNFKKITHYSNEEMLGKYVLDFIAEKDRDLITIRVRDVFEKGESFAEAHLLTKQGKTIPYYFTGCRILLQDQFYLIGLGQDITERKKMEKELWRLANTDFLTGLMSRRYFMRKIEEEFKLLRNHDMCYCSVLMLDLDHFKHINDTYGHAVGDTVLKHFSALLQSNLRQMDVAGRLGGEEFAVILPNIDTNEAKQCAERLRNIIANSPIIENDNVISITVSIGISMLRENDRYADTALIRADSALFAAKNNGRNTIQIAA